MGSLETAVKEVKPAHPAPQSKVTKKNQTSPLAFSSGPRGRISPRRASERHERRTCGDTIEETSSSDEVLARKKRPRSYRESPYYYPAHLHLHTGHLFHVYIQSVHGWCYCMMRHSANFKCHLPTCSSLRLKSRVALVVRPSTSAQPIPLDVTLEEPLLGGYVGVRARERPCRRTLRAPNTHQRGRRRSTREPGLHHWWSPKITAVGTPATQTVRTDPALPMPNSRRPAQPRSRQQREYFRCGHCGSHPDVYTGNTYHGLMMHMDQKHGGQQLPQECVANLRQLDRATCVICGAVSIAAGQSLQPLQEGHRDSGHHSR